MNWDAIWTGTDLFGWTAHSGGSGGINEESPAGQLHLHPNASGSVYRYNYGLLDFATVATYEFNTIFNAIGVAEPESSWANHHPWYIANGFHYLYLYFGTTTIKWVKSDSTYGTVDYATEGKEDVVAGKEYIFRMVFDDETEHICDIYRKNVTNNWRWEFIKQISDFYATVENGDCAISAIRGASGDSESHWKYFKYSASLTPPFNIENRGLLGVG